MRLRDRIEFGWFIETETPSPGKAAACSINRESGLG
jgi:hypothetical protein